MAGNRIDRGRVDVAIKGAANHADEVNGHLNNVSAGVQKLSENISAKMGSQMYGSFEKMLSEISRIGDTITNNCPLANSGIVDSANAAGESVGETIYYPNKIPQKVSLKAPYFSNAVGVSDYASASSEIQAIVSGFNSTASEMAGIINSYKDVWDNASEHGNTGLANQAHEAAEAIRYSAQELNREATNFSTKLNAYIEQTMSEADAANSEIAAYVETIKTNLSTINFDMPKAF